MSAVRSTSSSLPDESRGQPARSLDLAGDLGERARSARRAERIYGTADTVNYFRKPFGRGWALVGDAGLAMDPVTGQAYRTPCATRVACRVNRAGAAGSPPIEPIARAARNAAMKPMYDFTTDLPHPPLRLEQQLVFAALERDPRRCSAPRRLTGVPIDEFSPRTCAADRPARIARIAGSSGRLPAPRGVSTTVACPGWAAQARRVGSGVCCARAGWLGRRQQRRQRNADSSG